MTDEALAKRMAELGDAFNDFCSGRDCGGCEMEAFANEGVCCHAWIWKRMKGEEDAGARLMPNQEEAHLPAWCKEGQWVMDKQGNICEITRLGYPHKAVRVCIPEGGGRSLSFEGRWLEEIAPVKFLPYTYEEAKGLLGKVMEYGEGDATAHSILIGRVSRSGSVGTVFIHSYQFEDWQVMNATIDGLPIGVPMIDEEAMKGGEE